MSEVMDPILRELGERLDRADTLFKEGNLSGAAKMAHAVEDELETQRKQAPVGSAQRRECMRMLKRARATLDRLEFAAGIDEDEDDEDD